jgi:hypothetical protein
VTNEEGQEIKAQLIELGFWGVDELGDPTANIYDAGKLNYRLQAKLAENVFLVSGIPSGRPCGREIVIFDANKEFDILPPPNAVALWRGIPGLPPGRFKVHRKRLLACSPKELPAPSVLFFSRHSDPGGSPTGIPNTDRFSSPV